MTVRRTLEETRQLVLEAAEEILTEIGYTISTEDLSMIDACRRAGLATAGSAYKIWPDQAAFRTDVLRHVLSTGTNAMIDFSVVLATTQEEQPSLQGIIRLMGNASAAQVLGQATFDLFMALWSASRKDPELMALIRADEQDIIDQMDPIYEFLLELYDLEMVPPYTVRMLTVAFASLINGFGLYDQWIADEGFDAIPRPTGPTGESQPWHIMSCVGEAVVAAFTRPRGATTGG